MMRNAAPVSHAESSISSLLGRERLPAAPKKSNLVAPVVAAIIVLLLTVAVFRMATPHQAVAATRQIVGAGQDIFPGSRITFHDLHYITIPEAYYDESMSSKTNLLVGRTARTFIGKGEPVLATNLFPGLDGVAQKIENHERAVTLKLDDYALVDHSLTSGDHVDVLVTTTVEGKKFTKTVCQNLAVLFSMPKEALHSGSLRGQEANHITLAVTPQQAELLAQAEDSGKIKLSLRNRLATMEPLLDGVSETSLLPESAKHLLASKNSVHSDADTHSLAPVTVPMPPLLPGFSAPPAPDNNANSFNAMAPINQTAKWAVEIFSGSKREIYEVPQTISK